MADKAVTVFATLARRPVKVGDQSGFDRVAARFEDDRNCRLL
jgi:hypothetical protein